MLLSRRAVLLLLAAVCLAGTARAAAAQPDVPFLTPTPIRGAAGGNVIVLFSDFQCPYCARVGEVLEEAERRFPGQLRIVFKHLPLPIHPQAPLAHMAAVEAASQGKFWEMHDLLFANQQKLEKASLTAYATQLGLNLRRFEDALASRRHTAAIERDMIEARALGVNSTPTLFVNGRRLVGVPTIEALAAAISGTPEETAGAPAQIAPEQLNLAGAPSRGPDSAAVTIVEFSDLQCSFCAKAASTLRDVMRRYEGRVRWVFKHYPLDFHADAPLAHQAALAAGEQGRFWEMHDAIFTSQHAMKRPDLLRLAGGIGLDLPRFERDLDSGRFSSVIERDRREGATLGVDGTPTFFVNGHRLVGAHPVSAFAAIIDREIAAADTAAAGGALELEWFSDLRNPLSREAASLIKRLRAQYGTRLQVVFRHRPLEGRAESMFAHEAVMAAAEQGKFWEMHDLLLVQQAVRSSEEMIQQAGRLGLDPIAFTSSLASGRHRIAIESDVTLANSRDVRGTPVIFIGGRRFDGIVPLRDLTAAVEAGLSELRAGR